MIEFQIKKIKYLRDDLRATGRPPDTEDLIALSDVLLEVLAAFKGAKDVHHLKGKESKNDNLGEDKRHFRCPLCRYHYP